MKYQALINKMTIEEKASLLSGKDNFSTKTITRLAIPSMNLADGPHGVRKQAGAADHLGLNASLPATAFPTAATVANSWDVNLGEALGERLGAEAVDQGIHVLLGPGLNIKRSPLCGRNFEYFSEDPYLSGKMAAAYIRGIQSKGISACLKHFAVNSQETLRMHSDSVLDERTLYEIYLTGFEIAVKEGHPKSLMTAYNKINGIYANEEVHLLRDILVDEWGFRGFVVTDWGGSNDRVTGLASGNHLEMPATNGDSDREIVTAVKEGRLSEELVDRMINEYLEVLFDVVCLKEASNVDIGENHKFAEKVAESCIVLLKNEANILPLKTGTRVAVIGDFAKNPRYQGAGSSIVNPTKVDNTLDGIENHGLRLEGYCQGFLRGGGVEEVLKKEAIRLAKNAEVVLLYMGLDEVSECEGLDRKDMKVNENQIELLEAISKVNSNVVVVFSGGSPFEMPWVNQCKGILHGYLNGQAGAESVVKAIVGKVNPSGKLNETWANALEDTPCYEIFPGKERTAEYREGVFVGYRYYQKSNIPVRYPFGFGLSYTTFSYTNLKVLEHEVSFNLTNTGNLDGAEVVQVYIGKEESELFLPKRELKGFAKVYLKQGEERKVTISLDDKAFRYYNIITEQFEIEGGTYKVMVGASSEDIRLDADVVVAGSGAKIPYDLEMLPHYYSGKIKEVEDEEFEALIGRPIPDRRWNQGDPLGRNDTISQLFYGKSWIGRLVYRVLVRLKKKSEKKGTPDLNILFIFNLPFRGIAKMMGGAVNMDMVDAILKVVNGQFFKGVGDLIRKFFRKRKLSKRTKKKLKSIGKEF